MEMVVGQFEVGPCRTNPGSMVEELMEHSSWSSSRVGSRSLGSSETELAGSNSGQRLESPR